MLKAMRTGAQSIIVKLFLFGLLLMAMTGLAVMDVQGMFRRGVSDTTVAHIGNDKISATQFERIVSMNLRQRNIPQNIANKVGLPQQILTQEINSRIYAKAAADAGIVTDDAAAAKTVKTILQPMVQQGLTEKDALNRLLTNAGLTESALVGSVKQQLATDTLVKILTSGARAPRQMVDDALKYKYEQRRADYFKLTAADVDKVSEPSEDELKEYYKTVASRFALPEYRSFAVLTLDKKSLGVEQKESAENLKKYYDEHIADYTTPETRVVAQAVAPDEASAKAVYEAATTSKDLQKAAAAAGKGKVNYIKAQTFAEKDMPVELSPAAFKGATGTILPPVKSALGWHVLYVEKVNAGAVKSFDSVKADIEKDLTADKSAEALYEQANKIDDLLAGGKTLDEVAQQYSLKPVSFDKIDAQGNDTSKKKAETTLPAFDKVLEQAFRLNKDETSQLIETPTGEFLIVSVKDIFAPAEQPLDKVRQAVLDSWKQKQSADTIDSQTAKITERLKLGESFDKVAASFGKTPASTEFLMRDTDAEKAKLDRGLIPALFGLEKTGDATATANGDSILVLRLSARRAEMPKEQSKEDLASLEAQLNRSLQDDILDQYRNSLLAKYDVTINDKLMADLFKAQEDEAGND
jgi:peptidyl-prolyl cis-trans isomerase D